MKQRITMKELSKKLNVSISTVSKALNDSKEISQETKKKVRKFASLNHYVPNGVAKNLKLKKTKTIGVILPSVQLDFYAKALEEIIAKADFLGYKIYISISHNLFAKEVESAKNFIERQIDGLIISFSKETLLLRNYNHLENFGFYDIPIVQFNQISQEFRCDKIFTDDILYSKLALTHLYNSGCRNIAYISGISGTPLDLSRQKEFNKSIEEMNLKNYLFIVKNEFCSVSKFSEFLNSYKIDGILASDELISSFVMQNILSVGLRIPEDISMINLADGHRGMHFIPSISTIDQKAKEQGALALETIIKRINGTLPRQPVEYKIKAEVIDRESTRRCREKFKKNFLKTHSLGCG